MTAFICGDNTGDDYSGTDDTIIASESSSTTTNFEDAVEEFTVNYWTATDEIYGLLRFTGITSVPGTINSAALHLYCFEVDNPNSETMTLKRLLRDWVVSEAAHVIWKTSNNWTTAGGLSDTNDRSSTVTGTWSTDNSTGDKTITSAAQFVTDCDNMRSGSVNNEGWHFEITSFVGTEYRRFRDDGGTDGQRPYISGDYTAAAGGSSSLTLLGVG